MNGKLRAGGRMTLIYICLCHKYKLSFVVYKHAQCVMFWLMVTIVVLPSGRGSEAAGGRSFRGMLRHRQKRGTAVVVSFVYQRLYRQWHPACLLLWNTEPLAAPCNLGHCGYLSLARPSNSAARLRFSTLKTAAPPSGSLFSAFSLVTLELTLPVRGGP